MPKTDLSHIKLERDTYPNHGDKLPLLPLLLMSSGKFYSMANLLMQMMKDSFDKFMMF